MQAAGGSDDSTFHRVFGGVFPNSRRIRDVVVSVQFDFLRHKRFAARLDTEIL